MLKHQINNKEITYRLHVSFIVALILLILCFYLFPRFGLFHTNKNPPNITTINLIEIPVTIQNKIRHPQNLTPDINPEISQLEILDSVFIAIQDKIAQNNGTEIDNQLIAFISDIFPDLLEIKEFDPQPIIEASKKIYNFKNYFAYRMNLPDTGNPHEPTSPLVDEALGKSNKMIMVNILQIPLSSTKINNINKVRLTLDDLLSVKDHFHLLEYLYEEPSISLLELYSIKNVNESYTVGNLSDAVDALWKQGLIKVKTKQNVKIYSVSFTLPQIIESINRILTEISEQDQQNREYLYVLLQYLITWS